MVRRWNGDCMVALSKEGPSKAKAKWHTEMMVECQ